MKINWTLSFSLPNLILKQDRSFFIGNYIRIWGGVVYKTCLSLYSAREEPLLAHVLSLGFL